MMQPRAYASRYKIALGASGTAAAVIVAASLVGGMGLVQGQPAQTSTAVSQPPPSYNSPDSGTGLLPVFGITSLLPAFVIVPTVPSTGFVFTDPYTGQTFTLTVNPASAGPLTIIFGSSPSGQSIIVQGPAGTKVTLSRGSTTQTLTLAPLFTGASGPAQASFSPSSFPAPGH